MGDKLQSGTRLHWGETYMLLEQFGNGGEGRQVFLALRLEVKGGIQSGEPVILKLTRYDSIRIHPAVMEMVCLKEMRRKEFPDILEVYHGEEYLGIAETLMPGRSIREWIQKGRSFSSREFERIADQLGEILMALHERDRTIIYRDLKPEHLLLDEEGELYLVDFDGAVYGEECGIMVGNRDYSAPELFEPGDKARCMDVRSDIYGYGKIMQEIWRYTEKKGVSRSTSRRVEALLNQCVCRKKKKRPVAIKAVLERMKEIFAGKRKKAVGIGSILIVSFLFSCDMSGKNAVLAAEKEILPITFYNQSGQKILIRYDAVYEPDGDFYMALSKELFYSGKTKELCVILRDTETGEEQSRSLTLR